VLCSNCSASVRPVVALDIDGTLGEYHRHFIKFACEFLGKDPLDKFSYEGDIDFRDWFRDIFIEDYTTFRMVKLAYRQGGLKRTMKPYPWAQPMICELRAAGAEVWLTTTRPHERYDRVDPDTREWIRRNGIDCDGLIFDNNKYDHLADRIDRARVVAILDDLPDQIDRAAQIWGRDVPILRRTEFNKSAPSPDMRIAAVLNLYDAHKIINTRLETWGRKHGEEESTDPRRAARLR
jgi:hypothetical protein